MRSCTSLCLACVLLLLGCSSEPEVLLPAPLVITGATIIDGTGAAPIVGGTIVLDEERIVAIGPASDVDIPDRAEIVSADGKWIIPGMIDLHMHFWESGRPGAQPTYVADVTEVFPYEEEVEWMKGRARYTLSRYLCSGVTSVVALGAIEWEYDVRSMAEETATAPRVLLAGGFIGNAPPEESSPYWEGTQPGYWIEDPEDAPALVADLEATGIDLIKAGYVPHQDHPLEAFSPALESLVEASHARDLKISVHAMELESAKAALQAGADILAHTVSDQDVDEEFIRLARVVDVVNTSSAGVFTGHARLLQDHLELSEAEVRCGDPEVIDSWQEWGSIPMSARPSTPDRIAGAQKAEDQIVENIRALHDAGIRVAVGSDGGNIGSMHGPSFHTELRLLAEAGLTPTEVIIAATRTGAEALGREQDLGTLEPGKLGDLVILDADPLVTVANLDRSTGVVVKGNFIMMDQLNVNSRE